MKTTIAVMTAAILASGHLFAQVKKPETAASSARPLQLLGKTFAECEESIGKPSSIEDPKGEEKAFSRYYKSTVPNISRIRLSRAPDGAWDGPISPTVNIVTYYFPKGAVKTWKDAFTLIGINAEGATEEITRSKEPNSSVSIESPDFPKGWIMIQWSPSESTMKAPERYRLPNEDSLSFMGKMPTDKVQPSSPSPK